MIGNIAAVQEAIQNDFAEGVISARLESIQVRILGGKVLTGDVLCVSAVRGFADQHLANLTSVVPQLIGVAKRLNVEFPAVLRDEMETLARLCPADFKFVPPEE